jgi:arylsulfatase A-like enzyme
MGATGAAVTLLHNGTPPASSRRILALAAALGAAAATGSTPAPAPRPSFIVVTLDTFRADRIAVGADRPGPREHVVAPFLSALAASSTVFTRAVTPVGATHPAHASLFTGLHPARHGVRRNGHRLAAEHTTLAEHLKAAGYETAAFVQAGALLGRSDLRQGFDAVGDDPGAFHSSRWVNDAAIRWMAGRRSDGPFLLWVHYFDAHTPYVPTAHAAPLLAALGGPLACGAPLQAFLAYGTPDVPPTPPTDHALRAHYDSRVHQTHQRVRELLAEAAARGLLARSVVVVAGDHGQLLGEHGRTGYGDVLWQEALAVPLLVRAPGQVAQRLVAEDASLVDVLPTILDWIGRKASVAVDGRSLLPAIRGEAGGGDVVLCGTPPPPPGLPDPNPVAALRFPLKLVLHPAGPVLYDLARDPGEAAPLPGTALEAEAAQRLLRAARTHRDAQRP